MTKKTFLGLSIQVLCIAVLLVGCTDRDDDDEAESREHLQSESVTPPAAVLRSFTDTHPTVDQVRWTADGDNFESEFEIDGRRGSVVYDRSGKALESESEIAVSSLVPSIAKYIGSNYDGYHITLAERTVSDEGTTFEVRVDKSGDDALELVFSDTGSFLDESSVAVREEDEEGKRGEGVEENEDDEQGEGVEEGEDVEQGEGVEEDHEGSEARLTAGHAGLAYIRLAL